MTLGLVIRLALAVVVTAVAIAWLMYSLAVGHRFVAGILTVTVFQMLRGWAGFALVCFRGLK